MDRLRYVFSRRRRGHPTPTWRSRPFVLALDVRLAEMHTQEHEARPPDVLDSRDEEPRRRAHRRVWER